MLQRMFPAFLAIYLSSATVQAAPLPAPVQALLQQIKGEWVVLDQDILSTRLSLQADGRGELANRDGTSPISWRLEGGSLQITLLNPTTNSWFEYEDDQEYVTLTALQSLSFEFKKLEGLGTIIWKMTSQSQLSYPDHPEKGVKELSAVSESSRLIAGRQFKKFAPQAGQTLALALPDYVADEYTASTVSVLARLDSANVLTLIRGQEIGANTLYWTLDNGSLRVSDGKGYTVRYQQFQGDQVSAHLLATVQKQDRQFVSDETALYSNEAVRAQGFRADSPLFQGCWTGLQPKTTYCFPANRLFSFSSNDPDTGVYSAYGLWRLEEGRIIVDRYIDSSGFPLTNVDDLLACEKELADTAVAEKSCELFQTRNYELVNESAKSIGVYRILKHGEFISRDAHVFVR